MKRTLCIVLVFLLMLGVVPSNTKAQSDSVEIVYLENGEYLKITIDEYQTRASGTKSGRARADLYSASGELCWTAFLDGTFTYNGSSATCTSSSCSVSVYNDAWYVISKSANKSANTANADVSMGMKMLGVTVNRENITLQLTCDKDGNLS